MTPLTGQELFLGAAFLSAGSGGIARVARLTAMAAIDAGADLAMLSLLDKEPVAVRDVAVSRANGIRVAFAARCAIGALSRQHFIYDSTGLARAHLRLPGGGRPYAVWMHGIEVWGELHPGARAALLRSNLQLVNSEFTLRKYHERHGGRVDAKVCWLATEDDEPAATSPDFSGLPTVMILGRIDNSEGYKGHAELLAVWPRVVSAVPDARLLVVGHGPGFDEFKGLVAASPVAANIELAGFIPEAEIPAYWRRAHVLAMPSRKEGFGLVYIEAMRQALPVIGSIHDASPEVNIHGETGFNVDLDKGDGLAEYLVELLRSPDLCRDLGRAGQRRWIEHFRFGKFKERIVPILQEFCGNG